MKLFSHFRINKFLLKVLGAGDTNVIEKGSPWPYTVYKLVGEVDINNYVSKKKLPKN